MPPGSNVEHIAVDEKAGICITTGPRVLSGWLTFFLAIAYGAFPRCESVFLEPTCWDPAGCSNSHLQYHVDACRRCEYDNGYLVFDNETGDKEVWRLASDFSTEDEVAAEAPPNDMQQAASANAAEVYCTTSMRHVGSLGPGRC